MDLIDCNHVVDQAGQIRLDQVVLWSLEDHGHGWDYYVVAWRLAKDCGPLERLGGQWRIWFDGRWVVARVNGIETWSSSDVEVDDRRRLPPELRRRLK